MKRILLGGAVGTAVMTYSVRPKLVGESMDIVAKKTVTHSQQLMQHDF